MVVTEMLRIRTDQLASMLGKEQKKVSYCVQIAAERAADRWLEFLKKTIDDQGITHTGGYRNGFRVKIVAGRVVIDNDHPAAAVIELGCAPHPVSEAGQEAIRQWCVSKLGLGEEEARSAAYLICRKIRTHGQEPRYVVRNALPALMQLFAIELKNALKSEKVS